MRILGRRVVFYLITALAAITVDFFIPRMMPGNPVEAILAHLQGQISASHHQLRRGQRRRRPARSGTAAPGRSPDPPGPGPAGQAAEVTEDYFGLVTLGLLPAAAPAPTPRSWSASATPAPGPAVK